MLINNGMRQPNRLALEIVKFSILEMRYSRMLSIMSEAGITDSQLKKALKIGHGIVIDTQKEDTTLYVVRNSQTEATMKRHGVAKPTMLQILGTASVIATSREEAERKFKAIYEDDEEEPRS